jgi:hypothetical protein
MTDEAEKLAEYIVGWASNIRRNGDAGLCGNDADACKLDEAAATIRSQAEDIKQLRAAALWATSGKTGLSSECIARHMLGVPARGFRVSYPYDVGDFERCFNLLEAVPSWRGRIPEMAAYSEVWARLCSNWDEISEAFKVERAQGSFDKTYALIRDARGDNP